MQDRVVCGGGGRPEGLVRRPEALRIGAGEVDDQLVASDDHRAVDLPRPVGHDAVVLELAGSLVLAVGPARDLGPHEPLGNILDVLAALDERVRSVSLHELGEPPLGEIEGADHRLHVAVGVLGRPDVRDEDLEDRLDLAVLLVDLDRREADALLEDVLVVAEGGGHHAADVGHVRDVRRVREHLALVEVRLDDDELRQVAIRTVGVVREHDVAGAQVLDADLGDRRGHDVDGRADLRRDERRLRDHLRLTVEHDAREVERLVEHRRVARPHHRDPHLLARRDEVVADDLEQERIGADRGG